MTNDNPKPENLKFEPATTDQTRADQDGHPQTVERVAENEVIDAELLDEDTNLESEDGGFPGMDGMDEGMFAQVQEMMAKMEKADELEKENADLKGRLGRLAADFESYRRRTQGRREQRPGPGQGQGR